MVKEEEEEDREKRKPTAASSAVSPSSPHPPSASARSERSSRESRGRMGGGGPVLHSGFTKTRRGSLSSGGRGGQTGVMEAGVDIVWHYRTNFLRRTLRYWFRRAESSLPGLNSSLFLSPAFPAVPPATIFPVSLSSFVRGRKEGNDWNETRWGLRVGFVGVGRFASCSLSRPRDFRSGFGILERTLLSSRFFPFSLYLSSFACDSFFLRILC